MQGGRLRHKVELWAYVEKQNDYGEPIKNYSKVADMFAEIRPLKGTESFNEKEYNTVHTHKILCRYFNLDITSTMQIRWNGRVFEVDGAPSNWEERNIQWIFSVKEVFEHD